MIIIILHYCWLISRLLKSEASSRALFVAGESDPVAFSQERKPVIYRFFGAFSDALNLAICVIFQHLRELVLHGFKAFGVNEIGGELIECEAAAITCVSRMSLISFAVYLATVLPSFTNLTDLANHPGLRMPRAATSWASCLFAVDNITII
ncbi:TPA_asm: hypothetical protein G0G78_09880 [Salmonella enterica]|nr:hypothetical protein [Salmonella enterica]EBQ2127298.1 hypothetical protein [Salmonella enterica]EBT1276640.1 hypothetical protein [Salmonella enterica]MIV17055.1 hypothetical protein [Salmonella enterica]HAC8236873.1 hypothetical protein [Salmonella enterica]